VHYDYLIDGCITLVIMRNQ